MDGVAAKCSLRAGSDSNLPLEEKIATWLSLYPTNSVALIHQRLTPCFGSCSFRLFHVSNSTMRARSMPVKQSWKAQVPVVPQPPLKAPVMVQRAPTAHSSLKAPSSLTSQVIFLSVLLIDVQRWRFQSSPCLE